MTNERELKEKIDEKREESPYKCSLCDRAFPDRAEYESHQIGYMLKTIRFEHFLLALYSFAHMEVTNEIWL
jgi:hypothetical protein